jgi:hypothetical protein
LFQNDRNYVFGLYNGIIQGLLHDVKITNMSFAGISGLVKGAVLLNFCILCFPDNTLSLVCPKAVLGSFYLYFSRDRLHVFFYFQTNVY